MYFTETGAPQFLPIFETHKNQIRNFKGCSHLELLKDKNNRLCYTTLSYWNSEEDLEAYRNSPLFKNVWRSVKPLFGDKSQAFSLEKFIEV